jgi:hypothetical protein
MAKEEKKLPTPPPPPPLRLVKEGVEIKQPKPIKPTEIRKVK